MKKSAVRTNGTMNSTPTAWSESVKRRSLVAIPPPVGVPSCGLADETHVLLADRIKLPGSPLGRLARGHLVNDHLLDRLRENGPAVHEAGQRVYALQHLVGRAR